MPSQSRQQTTTAVSTGGPQAGAPAPAGKQALVGNEAVQEQLRVRQSPGKLTWQAALGESVGGKLYDALSEQLTDDRLLEHANGAVESALSALKGALAGNVKPTEQEAANLFVEHLDGALRKIAQDAVVNSGLSGEIRDLADANPYAVALAAAAGAVAYVLSNQDLPLIEAKLGLGGGHSLVGGVDPGRTMSLALEQVRVGYRYQGDRLAASLNVDRFQDGHAIDGRVQYNPNPDSQLALAGSHSDRAGVRRSKLDLTYMNRDLAATLGVERNVGGENPGQSIGASLSSRGGPDQLQRSLSGTWRDDGSWEAAAGIGKSDEDSSWSVEAFGGRDRNGNEEAGIRAMYKLRF